MSGAALMSPMGLLPDIYPGQEVRSPAEPGRGRDAGFSREGFSDLARPHLRSLVAVARGILGSEDLAWDAVQETLVSLWQLEEAPANLRAWLLRTTTHRSIHMLRTLSRCRKHEDRAAALRTEWCTCHDPARIAENRELCSELEEALAALPPEQRQVFLLRELEQMDYETIAQSLRVPIGTIRSRLNRARAALRAILKGKLANN
jgi:RNA polymerase sigma-70 factor (ECF subfamily)